MVARVTIMMGKSKRFKIYADASIRPAIQGTAMSGSQQLFNCGVGIHFEDNVGADVGFKVITTRCAISRIEMLAIRTALLLSFHTDRIIIYTDSQHCIMSLSPEIVNRSWFNANGISRMAESDIARECIEIIRARSAVGRKTKVLKVTAHNGVHGNVVADKIAGNAATGNYSAIITDDVTYSNGVAITTEDTYNAIIKAGRDIYVDIGLALKMSSTQSIASSIRTKAPVISGARSVMAMINNGSPEDAVDTSDDSDDSSVPRTVIASASEPFFPDSRSIVVKSQGESINETQLPENDNVTYGQKEITDDLSDIMLTPMSSSLVCVSCLDTVLIKHRNHKLFDGIDSTVGLTHCRTCVREIHGGKNPDSSLSLAMAGAWINPALLHGSNICKAVATVTGKDVTVLSVGRRTKYYSCRQVFSLLTRDDEIYALNVDDAMITTLRGGFF
jgi:ribonuclease HI